MARKYTRDNRGRFASKGGGATARGGRLKTASGNKRQSQTMQAKGSGSKLRNRNTTQLQNAASKGDKSALAALNAQRKGPLKPARTDTKGQGWGTGLNQGGAPKRVFAKAPAGTIGKPKGLKPQDGGKLKKGIAYNRLAGINAKMGNRPDLAQVNIKGRFTGQAGKRFDAGLARAVKETKAAQRASLNLKSGKQVRSEQSRAKKLRSVHEKAVVSKYAGKMGKPATEVRSAIRGMTASQQIKFFRQYVKENRATAVKPAAKPAAKRKPLTGVNSVVGRNLAGFKGLPVSLRSRNDAAAAQRQRNRRTIEATRSQVIGARRGVTSTAGGGQKLRVTRGQSQQMNLLTGKTDTVARINAKPVPTNTGAAPGSKSRRRSFGAMTRKMESPSSALGRRRLRASALEGARKKATPYNTKKASKTLATKGKALSFYESMKWR